MKRFVVWLVPACVALAGCGGSGSGDFIGTWNVSSGSETVTCGSGTQTVPLSGNDIIVEGTDSDILLTSNIGCNEKFNVSGKRATLVPGQSCDLGNGVTAKLTTGTITLGSDNKTYTLDQTLTLSASGETCNVTATEASVKVGG